MTEINASSQGSGLASVWFLQLGDLVIVTRTKALNLSQSKFKSFVEQADKNDMENKGVCQQIYNMFNIICSVFVICLS